MHFLAPTYCNSFVIISPKPELGGKSWAELNDPAYTIAVDLGLSQDQITKACLPKANILRFKTRDEAVLAVATGKADAIINTVFNGMVMTKKNAALGAVYVPTPILSSPSVIGMNHNSDDVRRGFVSAWADDNRRVGYNQTWILMGLEPFGLGLDDLPSGFDIRRQTSRAGRRQWPAHPCVTARDRTNVQLGFLHGPAIFRPVPDRHLDNAALHRWVHHLGCDYRAVRLFRAFVAITPRI